MRNKEKDIIEAGEKAKKPFVRDKHTHLFEGTYTGVGKCGGANC